MKKAIATKLVAALRSGAYKQGHGYLRKVDINGNSAFCCLGVLCNLHAQTHPKIAKNQLFPSSYMRETSYLPAGVVD